MKRGFLLVVTLLTLLVPSTVYAEIGLPDHPKFDLGVNLSVLRNRRPGDIGGVGGHFGSYIHRFVALEGDVFHSPGLFGDGPSGETVALFGAKGGVQSENFGAFVKLRPGFLHCRSKSGDCRHRFPGQNTFFALDAGIVLEYYPSPHGYARFDVGDTIVRFGGIPAVNFPGATLGTRHDTTVMVGLGVRF
jgi:hypothetical protein